MNKKLYYVILYEIADPAHTAGSGDPGDHMLNYAEVKSMDYGNNMIPETHSTMWTGKGYAKPLAVVPTPTKKYAEITAETWNKQFTEDHRNIIDEIIRR